MRFERANKKELGAPVVQVIGSVLSIIAMLVYAPGGYRFSDFIRVGLPMNLIILAANILIVNLV